MWSNGFAIAKYCASHKVKFSVPLTSADTSRPGGLLHLRRKLHVPKAHLTQKPSCKCKTFWVCLFDTIDVALSGHPSYGFDLHFHSFGNENKCVAAVKAGGQQHATGILHLSGFESIHKIRNGNYQKVIPISWSELLDSNQRPLEPHSSAIPNFAKPGYLRRPQTTLIW